MKFPRLIVCFFSEVRYQQETMARAVRSTERNSERRWM
jgi:hypothetical protein